MRNKREMKQLESPFEYLRRKDGGAFEAETVVNWYKARAYVLDKLKDVAFGVGSGQHLHVVLDGDSPRMLSVARQVALSAHFVNFDEDAELEAKHRTVITIVSKRDDIVEELEKEEFLSNLPKCCMLKVYDAEALRCDSFVDIELRVVHAWEPDADSECVVMPEAEVNAFFDSSASAEACKIDTRMAVLVGRIYNLGTLIDSLPYEDVHNPHRYALALDSFQYDLLRRRFSPLVVDSSWKGNLTKVKGGLSNIFCSDCFATRAREMALSGMGDNRRETPWERYDEALSKSEHARWVVDKLIMGYRPLNEAERFQEESLFGNNRNQYRKRLKNNASDPVHIDLCSYRDLHRIDPDSLKYDSFLMLGIPGILRRVLG